MKSFRILAALYDSETDRIEVVKEITEDDNSVTLNLHSFGTETLEWKAAEYDTEDLDELVDIIVNEPFMEELDTLSDPAAALARHRARNPTPRNNRIPANVKAQLRSAGVADKYISAVDDDPFTVVKQNSPFDEASLQVKKRYMAQVRERHASTRKVSKISRAERLEAQLFPQKEQSFDASGKSVQRTPQSQRVVVELPTVGLVGKKGRLHVAEENQRPEVALQVNKPKE